MRMKKFTLMLVVALMSAVGAMAQEATNDPHVYSMKDGTLAGKYSSYSYYDTWTSEDSLLTITFGGMAWWTDAQEGYDTYYFVLPGTVTIKAAEGYQIDSLLWQGWADEDTIIVAYENNVLTWIDHTDDNGGYIYLKGEGLKGMNELPLQFISKNDSANADFQFYDDGSYEYAYIGISKIQEEPTDDPTGITKVDKQAQRKDDAWYDMTGRRVATPGKGVYIRNGRKYVVK